MNKITVKTPKKKELFNSGYEKYINTYGPESIYQITSWIKDLTYFFFVGCRELEVPSYADDREGLSELVFKIVQRNKNILFKDLENLRQNCRSAAFWKKEEHDSRLSKDFKRWSDEQVEINFLANKKRKRLAHQKIKAVYTELLSTANGAYVSLKAVCRKANSHFNTVKEALMTTGAGEHIKPIRKELNTSSYVAKLLSKGSICTGAPEVKMPVFDKPSVKTGFACISTVLQSFIPTLVKVPSG